VLLHRAYPLKVSTAKFPTLQFFISEDSPAGSHASKKADTKIKAYFSLKQ